MCKFGVDPPWHGDSPIERMAFNLYAMEKEGYFSEDDDENSDEERDMKRCSIR